MVQIDIHLIAGVGLRSSTFSHCEEEGDLMKLIVLGND